MKEFFKEWWLLIVEILLVFGVGTGLSKYFKTIYHRLSSWRAREAMKQVMNVYRIIKDLKRDTKCERVIIIKTHNGNGKPTVKTVTKVTVLYEEVGEKSEPILGEWQERPLEGEARVIISNIVELGKYDVIVKHLVTGEFKGVFNRHKILWAPHYEIRASNSGYYILILWFKEDLNNTNILKQSTKAIVASHLSLLKKTFN